MITTIRLTDFGPVDPARLPSTITGEVVIVLPPVTATLLRMVLDISLVAPIAEPTIKFDLGMASLSAAQTAAFFLLTN